LTILALILLKIRVIDLKKNKYLSGVGLGLRREILDELLPEIPNNVELWEIASENQTSLRGKYQIGANIKKLGQISKNPDLFITVCKFVNHGL
jgi:hypothetical protein